MWQLSGRRQKRTSSALAYAQLSVYRMQNLRVTKVFTLLTMPLANLNAGVLIITETAADCATEKPTIEGLSQNHLSTYGLSRVKLGLGVLRKSRIFRRYLL